MLPHPRLLCAALAVFLALAAPASAQSEADAARALAKIWQQHTRAPAEHAALVQAVQQMAGQYADSKLLAVARGLGAWHALQAGQTNTARLLLLPLLAARAEDPISTEARVFAQRWLTRLDREQVRTGLQLYYRNHVEYPAALSALGELVVTNRPPLADRFGRDWKYELTTMKRLTKLRGQRYNLSSPTLGDDSDLGAMLRRPYGGGLVLWRTTRADRPTWSSHATPKRWCSRKAPSRRASRWSMRMWTRRGARAWSSSPMATTGGCSRAEKSVMVPARRD